MKSMLRTWGVALAMLAMVAYLDLITGWELKFTSFYLGPIVWIAWNRKMQEGIGMALLAALTWYAVDLRIGGPIQPSLAHVWNILNRLIGYGIAAWAVGAFRESFRVQEATIAKLNAVLDEVQELKGLLPVCAWCRKIRADDGHWQVMEEFLHTHTKASASHGICPDCAAKMRNGVD